MKRLSPLIKRYSRLIILGLFAGRSPSPVSATSPSNPDVIDSLPTTHPLIRLPLRQVRNIYFYQLYLKLTQIPKETSLSCQELFCRPSLGKV